MTVGGAASRRGRGPSGEARPSAPSPSPRRWDRMTRTERREWAAEITRQERAAQGLPEFCDDPAVYAYIARTLRATGIDKVVGVARDESSAQARPGDVDPLRFPRSSSVSSPAGTGHPPEAA